MGFRWHFNPCEESKNDFAKYKKIFVRACSTIDRTAATKGLTGRQRLDRKIQDKLLETMGRSMSPAGKYLWVEGHGTHMEVQKFGNQYSGYRLEMFFENEEPGNEYTVNLRFMHGKKPLFRVWLSNIDAKDQK